MTEQNTQTGALLPMIIEGLRNRKGRGITVIDMENLDTAPAHRFVIAQGTSTMHVASVADGLRDYLLQETGLKPYSCQGYAQARWIVMDYGDTLVHVFMPDERQRYDLEGLWCDAPQQTLPDEY